MSQDSQNGHSNGRGQQDDDVSIPLKLTIFLVISHELSILKS